MLYLRTFGTLSLDAGRPLSGAAGQRSRLALLAVLAVVGDSGISRDKLQSLFWPDSDTEHARGALKQALYALRRDLGDDVIIGNGDLRLNCNAISTDVGEFQRAVDRGDAEAAAAYYSAAFLDGVFLRGSPEFERWAEQERTRLTRAFLETLKQLASAADARGDYAGAVVWWQKGAAADPLSSSTAVSLVRSLALNGETARALRQAEIHQAVVKQEIGDHIDPAMSATIAAIHSGELGRRSTRICDETVGTPSSMSAAESLAVGAPAASGSSGHQKPAPPMRRVSRRWLLSVMTPIGLIVVLGFGAWQRRAARSVENSVAVVAVCASSITGGNQPAALAPIEAADLIRDRLTNGLTTLPNVTVRAVEREPSTGAAVGSAFGVGNLDRPQDRAKAAHARFFIFAKCHIDADSTLLSADVVDATSDRVVATTAPLRSSSDQLDSGIVRLRDRVLTAMALRVDPKLKNWVFASNAPSNFESYHQLRLGIDAFTKGELADAAAHFTKSAAADTASPTPLIWAAYARSFYFDIAADSILRELSASRRRLGPWDDAMAGFLKAFRQGDLSLAHVMAHRVAATAPNSEWRIAVATSALNAARPKESLDVLHVMDPAQGWMEGWVFYWVTLDRAHHSLGQYEEELRDDRRAEQSFLNNAPILAQAEVKALAALGRVAELTRRCDEAEAARQRGYWSRFEPLDQAAVEVRAHVGVGAARPLYDRLVARLRAHADSGVYPIEEDRQAAIADYLAEAGRLDEARVLLDSLLALHPSLTSNLALTDAKIAALQGDRDRAHRVLRALETGHVEDSPSPSPSGPTIGQDRPEPDLVAIHALLGENKEAVALLARGIGNGFAFRDVLHIWPGIERLRGYLPFDALVKPIESAENR